MKQDLIIGEWQTDAHGKRFRQIGNGCIEYESIFKTTQGDMTESQLRGFIKRSELDDASDALEAAAMKRADAEAVRAAKYHSEDVFADICGVLRKTNSKIKSRRSELSQLERQGWAWASQGDAKADAKNAREVKARKLKAEIMKECGAALHEALMICKYNPSADAEAIMKILKPNYPNMKIEDWDRILSKVFRREHE